MPARTNEFQELVALIERALAPQGAKIRQSVMESVPGLSSPREIDVLVEGQFGSVHMKIAYEAKNERRRIDVITVESLIGKYRGPGSVSVDKFVLVSSRGFTKGAIEKAKLADIELITLQEAKSKDWGIDSGLKVCRYPPEIVKFTLYPDLQVPDKIFAYNHGHFLSSDGKDHGSPTTVVATIFFENWLPKNRAKYEAFEAKVRDEFNGIGRWIIRVDCTGSKVKLGSTEHRVDSIEIEVKVVNILSGVECKVYERNSTQAEKQTIHHANFHLGDSTTELVINLGPDARPATAAEIEAHKKELAEKKKETKSIDAGWMV